MKKSQLERTFETRWRQLAPDAPEPVQEYFFALTIGRRWRFDFAWPGRKVAVEIEGGTWSRGRHTRGQGYRNDCQKYNAAVRLGWRLFRVTGGMLKDDPAGIVGMVKDELALSLRCKITKGESQ